MFGIGNNDNRQLGIVNIAGNVKELTEIPGINVKDIRKVVTEMQQSLLVMMNGEVYAAGKTPFNENNQSALTYNKFTKLTIFEEGILDAFLGHNYNIFLTMSGKLLRYDRFQNMKTEIIIPTRVIAISDNCSFIDEEGCMYINRKNNQIRYEFPAPAIDVFCSLKFNVVLLSDFRVFGNGILNNGKDAFAPIEALSGHRIMKIKGNFASFLALSDDGLVFAYRHNYTFKLNNCNEIKQIEFPNNAKIKDMACSSFMLFVSREGELFGLGASIFNQYINDQNSFQKVVKINID